MSRGKIFGGRTAGARSWSADGFDWPRRITRRFHDISAADRRRDQSQRVRRNARLFVLSARLCRCIRWYYYSRFRYHSRRRDRPVVRVVSYYGFRDRFVLKNKIVKFRKTYGEFSPFTTVTLHCHSRWKMSQASWRRLIDGWSSCTDVYDKIFIDKRP